MVEGLHGEGAYTWRRSHPIFREQTGLGGIAGRCCRGEQKEVTVGGGGFEVPEAE